MTRPGVTAWSLRAGLALSMVAHAALLIIQFASPVDSLRRERIAVQWRTQAQPEPPRPSATAATQKPAATAQAPVPAPSDLSREETVVEHLSAIRHEPGTVPAVHDGERLVWPSFSRQENGAAALQAMHRAQQDAAAMLEAAQAGRDSAMMLAGTLRSTGILDADCIIAWQPAWAIQCSDPAAERAAMPVMPHIVAMVTTFAMRNSGTRGLRVMHSDSSLEFGIVE